MTTTNKLSDKQLKSINGKPYARSKMLTDGAGLAVRISVQGKIGWVYRYRLGERNTHPKWVRLGSYPETILKQTRDKSDQCREWLDNGLDLAVELQILKDKREKPVCVQDAFEHWLVEYAEEHRRNVGKHRAQFKKHIYPHIG